MPNPAIGLYEFVTLHRVDDPKAPPLIPREQCQPINRPGVDGTAIMKLGKRSETFQMRSGVDVLSVSVIPLAIKSYSELIGKEPQTLTWQGVDYSAYFSVGYVVMDVIPLRSCRLSAKSGGLVSGATAWLEMLWTLQPVLIE